MEPKFSNVFVDCISTFIASSYLKVACIVASVMDVAFKLSKYNRTSDDFGVSRPMGHGVLYTDKVFNV